MTSNEAEVRTVPAADVNVGPAGRRRHTGAIKGVLSDHLRRLRDIHGDDYAPEVDCVRRADGSLWVEDAQQGAVVLAAAAGDVPGERQGMIRCRTTRERGH